MTEKRIELVVPVDLHQSIILKMVRNSRFPIRLSIRDSMSKHVKITAVILDCYKKHRSLRIHRNLQMTYTLILVFKLSAEDTNEFMDVHVTEMSLAETE